MKAYRRSGSTLDVSFSKWRWETRNPSCRSAAAERDAWDSEPVAAWNRILNPAVQTVSSHCIDISWILGRVATTAVTDKHLLLVDVCYVVRTVHF